MKRDGISGGMMLFSYDELKKHVQEDFERFCGMGFDETQVLPAVLDEFQHGQDFTQTENICIHVILVLCYEENGWDAAPVRSKIKQLTKGECYESACPALGDAADRFLSDFKAAMEQPHLPAVQAGA